MSIKCRFCGSINLIFEKWVHNGKIQGTTFHYKAICHDCRKSYHIERCKEVFDAVKDQEWKTKKKKREERTQSLF